MPALTLPAWLWPSAARSEPEWNVRLGRVVHWVFAFLAAATLGLSALLTSLDYKHAEDAKREIAAWDKRHAKDDPKWPGRLLETDNVAWSEVQAFVDDPDPRPYDNVATIQPLLAGIALALGLLLAGRGLRYIIAGE